MSKTAISTGKTQKRAPRVVPRPPGGEGSSSEGIEDFFKIVCRLRGLRGSHDAGLRRVGRARHRGSLTRILDDLSLVETVKRGVPVRAVDTLIEHKVLTRSEIDSLVMPRRTLAHRERKRELLNAIESERVLRIARIIAIAEDTFANSGKAARWLRRPSRLFGGKFPLAMADTEPGGRMVEDVLQRIAHGIAA